MNEAFVEAMRAGYALDEPSIIIGSPMHEGELTNETRVQVALSMMTRHGLVAGATGTGKTKTCNSESRTMPPSPVGVTVPSDRAEALFVPGLLRPRMAVDLGLPLDRVSGFGTPEIACSRRRLRPWPIVYHDRWAGQTAKEYGILEADERSSRGTWCFTRSSLTPKPGTGCGKPATNDGRGSGPHRHANVARSKMAGGRARLGAADAGQARTADRRPDTRLEAVYLAAWDGLLPQAELQRAATIARVLGCIGRALAWERSLGGLEDDEMDGFGDGVAGWLVEFAGRLGRFAATR